MYNLPKKQSLPQALRYFSVLYLPEGSCSVSDAGAINPRRHLHPDTTAGALKLADDTVSFGHHALLINKYSKITHSHLCISVNGPMIWLSITVLDLNCLRFQKWLEFIFLFIKGCFPWLFIPIQHQ